MLNRPARLALSLVLAIAVILGAYYLTHKPITPLQVVALGGVGADAGVALLLTILGGAVGRRVLAPPLTPAYRPPLPPLPTELLVGRGGRGRGWGVRSLGEQVALEAALGWGCISTFMLGLGMARLYLPWLIWVLALSALAFLRRDARGWLADVLAAARALPLPDALSRFSALLVVIVLALGLLWALAPPVMWDALVYHLTLPKLYAQIGSVWLADDFMFKGMPQLNEMLFTAAYLMRGASAAQALGWAFGAVLALGLAAHAGEVLGPRGAALAPALLFASFTIALSLAWAYAELLMMLMTLGVLIALRQWRQASDQRWLWLAGALAGLTVACKYTGVIVPMASSMMILASPLPLLTTREARGGARPRALLHFAFPAALACAPWLIKNWLLTGNPAYPLLLPTAQMDALRLFFYNRPDLLERNPLWAALIFFRAVFIGAQGQNSYDATLGPLWVFLPLALAVGWRVLPAERQPELKPLAVFALAAYVIWVGLMFVSYYAVQARLFFAIFPALAIVSAGGLLALEQFNSSALRVSIIARAATAFILGLSLLQLIFHFGAHNPLAYLTGAESARAYRLAHLGGYALALEDVNALPEGARVLFLWEPRSLECAPGRCDPDVIIDRWYHLRRTLRSADNILAQWKTAGFTHVFIDETGVQFVKNESTSPHEATDWAELEALRARLRPARDIGGSYSLYEIP